MQNSINITGRLVRDIDLRQTHSGIVVGSFAVACRRNWKGSDGEYGTDFFNCTAWRHSAEYIAKYAQQGDLLILTGRLQQEHWCNSQGDKRSRVVIVVEDVSAIEKRGEDGRPRSETPPEHQYPNDPQPPSQYTEGSYPKEVEEVWSQYEKDHDGDLPF